jgi:hypothetical protein
MPYFACETDPRRTMIFWNRVSNETCTLEDDESVDLGLLHLRLCRRTVEQHDYAENDKKRVL